MTSDPRTTLGKCTGCGVDLDDLAARGYQGHACSRPAPAYPPKLRLQNVPPALIRGAARALDEDEHVGREPYDWRGRRTSLMRHVGGIQRHLLAFLDGQDVDPDSPTGKLHLEGIAGRLAILLDAFARGDYTDDRPSSRGEPEDWTSVLTPLSSHAEVAQNRTGNSEAAAAADEGKVPDEHPVCNRDDAGASRQPPATLLPHAPGCSSRRGPGCDCGADVANRTGLNI